MSRELAGKTVLLTGATEGIGKAAALELARRGADVAIVGRNRAKSEAVLAELGAAADGGEVELYLADLSSQQEVRRLASEFGAKHDRLDVLVNNAGGVFQEHSLTEDGLERTFALNHLSYFLLSVLLADLLKATPGARVVSTSSGAHQTGKLELSTVAKRPDGRAGFGAYGDSKLANVLFTRELARRLGPGVAVNCFHPGFVQTGFGLNNRGLLGSAIKYTAALFARTPEKGAETLVWLASSPEAAGTSGEYFMDRKVARTSRRAKDDALAARLWTLSEELTGAR